MSTLFSESHEVALTKTTRGNFLKQIGLHIELQDDPSFVSIIKLYEVHLPRSI